MKRMFLALMMGLILISGTTSKSSAQTECVTIETVNEAATRYGYELTTSLTGTAIRQLLRAIMDESGRDMTDEELAEGAKSLGVVAVYLNHQDSVVMQSFDPAGCRVAGIQLTDEEYRTLMKNVEQKVTQ